MLKRLSKIEYLKKDLPYSYYVDNELSKIGQFPLLKRKNWFKMVENRLLEDISMAKVKLYSLKD